jgi:hypothetical protein
VLYEIVFGAKEVSTWWRKEVSLDYNSLKERIYRYHSRSLRFSSWLLNVETNGTVEVLCQENCSSLCRRGAVGRKTSNRAKTYRKVSIYRRVDCCNERSIENQAAKLNVERRVA